MGIKTGLAAAALFALALAVPASAAIASSTPHRATTTTATTTTTTAGTAVAAPGRVVQDPHPITLAPQHAVTANAAPAASSPPSCWTQFAPTNPNGIEMAQYYRNCNGYAVNVFFGYTLNGVTHALTNCTTFNDGSYALVVYSSTVVGSNYGTFLC